MNPVQILRKTLQNPAVIVILVDDSQWDMVLSVR